LDFDFARRRPASSASAVEEKSTRVIKLRRVGKMIVHSFFSALSSASCGVTQAELVSSWSSCTAVCLAGATARKKRVSKRFG